MRIAIDLSQIPTGKTGVGIYAVNLVREILRLNDSANEFDFYFFAQDDDDEWKQLIPNTNNSHLIPVKSSIFRKLIFRFFFEQFLLPRKCKESEIDLLFSFHYTMPYLTRIMRVVMIPDMTFYLFPGLHRGIKRLYFKSLIPLSVKKSRCIIIISESSKRDLLRRFPALDPGKVEVIHLGVNLDPPLAKGHLVTFGLKEKKYFLFVGTLEPRKNIPNIIEAFHHVMSSGKGFADEFKLVIVGKQGWFYQEIFAAVKAHGLEEAVIFTGYVEEEVKQSLLAQAFLFIYPSFYEGFGLPVLEAMVYGVPVITGNVSSLPEVSGDAALLINPREWQEIAGAMLRLLSDKEFYADLSKKSLAQAKRFTWQHTATKTLALFKSLITGTTNP